MNCNINIGNQICYIEKHSDAWYSLITSLVTAVKETKKGILIHTIDLKPIDYSEIEMNTRWLQSAHIVLIQEPFLDTGNLKERAERWIEHKGWEYPENKY